MTDPSPLEQNYLKAKKIILRSFIFILVIILGDLGIAIASYVTGGTQQAGIWVLFSAVWFFFAAKNRNDAKKLEHFHEHHSAE